MQEEETKLWKKMINVAVSGAAGMISNHLLFKVKEASFFSSFPFSFNYYIVLWVAKLRLLICAINFLGKQFIFNGKESRIDCTPFLPFLLKEKSPNVIDYSNDKSRMKRIYALWSHLSRIVGGVSGVGPNIWYFF